MVLLALILLAIPAGFAWRALSVAAWSGLLGSRTHETQEMQEMHALAVHNYEFKSERTRKACRSKF